MERIEPLTLKWGIYQLTYALQGCFCILSGYIMTSAEEKTGQQRQLNGNNHFSSFTLILFLILYLSFLWDLEHKRGELYVDWSTCGMGGIHVITGHAQWKCKSIGKPPLYFLRTKLLYSEFIRTREINTAWGPGEIMGLNEYNMAPWLLHLAYWPDPAPGKINGKISLWLHWWKIKSPRIPFLQPIKPITLVGREFFLQRVNA